jgi:hypothetical protein
MGTTVFCDPQTWTPRRDQFAHLSAAERLSPDQVEVLVDKFGEVKVGPTATAAALLPPNPRRGALDKAPATVRARLSSMLAISTAGLPSSVQAPPHP